MIRRPPRSTLFPSRRSSDLILVWKVVVVRNRSHLRHSRDSRRTPPVLRRLTIDRKSTRLNSSHDQISYAVFCLKKKKNKHDSVDRRRLDKKHRANSKSQRMT